MLLQRLRVAPEQLQRSLVYSQPFLPPSVQGHDSIPSSFSHPLYFLFSSQLLVSTDNRKKMKAGKGALCLFALPACIFYWIYSSCLALSVPVLLLLLAVTPEANIPPYPLVTPYLCTHIYTFACYAHMHCLMHTYTLQHTISVSFSL